MLDETARRDREIRARALLQQTIDHRTNREQRLKAMDNHVIKQDLLASVYPVVIANPTRDLPEVMLYCYTYITYVVY